MSGRSWIFLAIAGVAAFLGFGVLTSAIAGFAKLVFIAFLIALAVSVVKDNKPRKKPPSSPGPIQPPRPWPESGRRV